MNTQPSCLTCTHAAECEGSLDCKGYERQAGAVEEDDFSRFVGSGAGCASQADVRMFIDR